MPKHYSDDPTKLMKQLPADLVMEYREAFTLFDKDNDDQITPEEFATVIRSLGINPLESEIDNLLDLCAPGGMLDFPSFCLAMTKNQRLPDSKDDLLKAFYIFDKENTGLVKATELKSVLTTLGEVLSESEVDQLLATAGTDSDGNVNYKDFTNRIFA